MSTTTERNPKWNKSLSFPFRSSLSQPFMVNNDEFVVVPSTVFNSNADGIYKFNTQKNEWTKIFDYDKNFECDVLSVAYDNKHKLLYICDLLEYPPKMLSFDLRNKVTTKTEQDEDIFTLIFIEDKLHKICDPSGDHYIYDKTKQFKKITTFKYLKEFENYSFIYLQSQKSILLFGVGYQNSIYRFSCIDSKWEELNIEMQIKFGNFGLVSTKNEQYIIILGGWANGYEYTDDIFIYDMRNNIFTKSKMKCPKKGTYHAVIMNNSKRDEITSFGFVNGCYKTEHFVGMQLLPQYLIKIICCYYCNEEIYLLERGSCKHWKINVDYILQS